MVGRFAISHIMFGLEMRFEGINTIVEFTTRPLGVYSWTLTTKGFQLKVLTIFMALPTYPESLV